MMVQRKRVLLGLLAFLLVLAALVLIGYALAPTDQANLQATLAPTYLTPPLGAP
jgi:hypothetical protein